MATHRLRVITADKKKYFPEKNINPNIVFVYVSLKCILYHYQKKYNGYFVILKSK